MITLNYPSAPAFIQTITLKNPDLGNSNQVNLKTMIKQNMVGDIHTHKKTPTNEKLLLQFTTLTRTEKDALVSFYTLRMGQQIRYVDHEATVWICRIANDSLVITTRRDECSYDAIIELITV